MWRQSLCGLALMAMAWSLLAADVLAEQRTTRIQVQAPDGVEATDGDVVPAAIPDSPSKGMPTPAKRRPSGMLTPIAPGESDLVAPPPAKNAAPKKSKTEEPLRPIADPMENESQAIEAASFSGVIPGTSTLTEVEQAWGEPKRSIKVDGETVQLYSVKPFDKVEIHSVGGKVASIVIRLDRPFPADAVAKQLELISIRAVMVSNEKGEVLGLSYPERGVLLSMAPGKELGKPSMKVMQIVLEPISAEPFVLRAETMLTRRLDLSRRDLKQAISLEPENARAHWLLSRVLTKTDDLGAGAEAAKAVQLDPKNAQYQVTLAQLLAETGRWLEAAEVAKRAVENSQKRPHIRALATCLMGDLAASGPEPDFNKALNLHTEAIRIADALAYDPHPAIRVAAKKVLVDAHLGAAHDIAWGQWKEKPKAVTRWLERAVVVADDLVNGEGAGQEKLLRVYTRALAAYVGVQGGIDPEPTVQAAVEIGDALIAAARDPRRKAELQRELGAALYDALQICQMRDDHENALRYGEKAVEYLNQSQEAAESESSNFLLGRLYFRLGTILATHDQDHKAAVVWFDKAVPLLEDASPDELSIDFGRHGESLVGMGVSYWETGNRDRALSLTKKGVRWMEQAVKRGEISRSSLTVPYGNLSAMLRATGSEEAADRFQEMATRLKSSQLK